MRKKLQLVCLVVVAIAFNVSVASAQALGTAQNFALLSGTALTCTTSPVTGNIAVWPGTAVTGCTPTGTTDVADAAAQQGFLDFVAAYNNLRDHPPACDLAHTLTGPLTSMTLVPGTYCVDAVAKAGALMLDGQGNANASWLFLVNGALTGTGFNVTMLNSGNPCNVLWWVGGAATMTTSNLIGTVLAGAAITTTGGTVQGDLLAMAGLTLTGTPVTGCATVGSTMPPPMKCDADMDKDHDRHHDGDHDMDKDKDHDDGGDHDMNDNDRKDNDRKDNDRNDKDHESGDR
jgi:hypothetical protein